VKNAEDAQNRRASGNAAAAVDQRLGNGQEGAGPQEESPPLALAETLRFPLPQLAQPEGLSLPDPAGGFFFQPDFTRQVYAFPQGQNIFP
jgi:hypothetical protein